ncbi:hypothetical protein GmHk_15G044187 [Glycine max]|nr:hypothetical protein GmHk_15G044187 [Glycine max]
MTYLLHLISNTIFTNKSLAYIHVAYLQYLGNLDACHEYALGVVALCTSRTISPMQASRAIGNVEVFAHFPTIGYSKRQENYVVEDPIATRWKPLRGSGLLLSIRDIWDNL